METVDLSTFEKQNAAAKAQRKRVNWDERTELVDNMFPGATRPDWETILGDVMVFGRVMRDVLKADQVEPGRAGPRPPLDYERGVDSLRKFADSDYTTLPFHQAVAALIGSNSRTQVSRKTGLERTRCHRIIANPDANPTVEEMEAFARAYGKRPEYFLEYRTQIILNRLEHKLMTQPETSIVMFKRLKDG